LEDADPASDPTARLFRMANRGGIAYADEDGEEGEEETEDDEELVGPIGEGKVGHILLCAFLTGRVP